MKLLDTLSDDLTRFAMREMLAHLVRLERQAVLRSSHDPVARWYPASDLVTAPSGIDEGARHSRHRGPRLTSQRTREVAVNKSSRWHLAGRNLANIKKEG